MVHRDEPLPMPVSSKGSKCFPFSPWNNLKIKQEEEMASVWKLEACAKPRAYIFCMTRVLGALWVRNGAVCFDDFSWGIPESVHKWYGTASFIPHLF